MDYTYIKHVRGREEQSPGGFTRYENEDGRNKSDVGGSSESFLKAPRVTRQVYAETSIIPLTCFIASWANSAVPVLRFTAFVTPFFFFFFFVSFYFFSFASFFLFFFFQPPLPPSPFSSSTAFAPCGSYVSREKNARPSFRRQRLLAATLLPRSFPISLRAPFSELYRFDCKRRSTSRPRKFADVVHHPRPSPMENPS